MRNVNKVPAILVLVGSVLLILMLLFASGCTSTQVEAGDDPIICVAHSEVFTEEATCTEAEASTEEEPEHDVPEYVSDESSLQGLVEVDEVLAGIDVRELGEEASSYLSEISEETTESVTESSETTAESTPSRYMDLSTEEIKLLATLVYLESGVESYECQKAVASVVLNRVTSPMFPNTVRDVVYEPGQFSPASSIAYSSYTESTLAAVQEVSMYGPTVPQYVLFFRSKHYHDWGPDYPPYSQIDHTYFSYSVEAKRQSGQ